MQSIIRQKLLVNFDKNKNLLLQSIKLFANNKARVDKAILTKSQVALLLKQKNIDAFNNVLIKQFKTISALKLDSQAYKNKLCKHVRYRSTTNRIAHVLNRDNLQTIYDVAKKTSAKKTSAKKTVKLNKRQRVLKSALLRAQRVVKTVNNKRAR